MLCIYEDAGLTGFGALVQTRAVWDLKCGALTLAEKLRFHFAAEQTTHHLRKDIQPVYREDGLSALKVDEKLAEETIFLCGRVLIDTQTASIIQQAKPGSVFTCSGKTFGYKLDKGFIPSKLLTEGEPVDHASFTGLTVVQAPATLIDYPWQLVDAAPNQIGADLELLGSYKNCPRLEPTLFPSAVIRGDVLVGTGIEICPGVVIDAGEHPVFVEDNVWLGPGVIVDASAGPVWLAEHARVEAGAILVGPVYVGAHSIVRPGARLSNGVCLGPHCRVGGEITQTIFQGYSNKQHSGYLGTSYIGSWVNLGAATDNSDLKNNYRPVEVSIDGVKIDSNSLHVGVFIGDFSRTAIHTRLNSGSMVGVCCNIFSVDFPVGEIPSFTWVGSDNYHEYRLDKALETIRNLMSRRNCSLTPALEARLKQIFHETREARRKIMTDEV